MKGSKPILIPLVGGYLFSIDNCNNHTLYYREEREKKQRGNRNKGTGEMTIFTTTIGYYPNMKWLLKAMIADAARRKIDAGEITTAEEYLAALEKLTERIERI